MSIYLDSADLKEIKKYINYPFISGVTTNPALLAKALDKSNITIYEFEEHIKKIGDIVEGDIFVQTNRSKAEQIVKESRKIYEILGDKCVVKILPTFEGLKAMYDLSFKDIRTAATAVFTGVQGYTAILSGADYVVPYYSRLMRTTQDGFNIIEDILDIIEVNKFDNQLLVASLKTTSDVLEVIRAGANAITIPASLIDELYENPQTNEAVKLFKKSLRVSKD
ncbi:MAG: fructose-6-phosphate aldolase [Candidatus Eremiobacteraeota bacterium]|nr:fructose-6-phosphate aldolase [Candidatus Eremiobacteraeota bacterium]